MSKNPFGGYDRLDKCNLQGPSILGGLLIDVFSDVPGERTMICKMFLDDCNNYVNYALAAQNGTSLDQFFYASEFLLRVRASKPETWQGARLMRPTYFDEYLGRRVTRAQALTDDQLRMGCADYLWGLMEMPMEFEDFIAALRAERRKRIQKSQEQVDEFIALMNSSSLSRNILHKETIPLKLLSQSPEDILTDPTINPVDLCHLISYQPRRRRRSTGSPAGHCVRGRRIRICEKKPAVRQAQPTKGDLFACLETNSPESADSAGCCAVGLSA
jgi:hypothetical protein